MIDSMSREDRAKLKSFQRFSAVPDYDNPRDSSAATVEHPRFVARPMRAGHNGLPDTDDLKAVVQLSQRDKYIRGSSDLTELERMGLYASWYKMFPLAFALLERIPADRNGASIIGNTAILPLSSHSMKEVAEGTLKVINLNKGHLARSASDRILLFDTWVMHGDYKWSQCEDALVPGKLHSCQHHGFGNVLTLKHLGILWKPKTRLRLYVEPSADAMERLVFRLGFKSTRYVEKGKKLLFLDYDPNEKDLTRFSALHHQLTEDVLASLQQYRNWWAEEWPKRPPAKPIKRKPRP